MAKAPGLKLKTWMPFEQIEELLAASCQGPYKQTLHGMEEMSEGNPRKVMRIMFADAEDRERFRQAFRARKSGGNISAPAALQDESE